MIDQNNQLMDQILVTSPRSNVQCANCGSIGHIYKACNHPITSYGIICFRFCFNSEVNSWVPQYLLVQRKDSLSYVEFIRGKYTPDQKIYLLKLFSNMTIDERTSLMTEEFETLWKRLWQSESCKSFVREFAEAKGKFEMLRRGYIMKNSKNKVYYFDIDFIINNTESVLKEPEWGFPKGRRNINEHDFNCAVREFKEETGIAPRHIRVIGQIKPFEEVFSGSNKVRYKHIYYVALCMKPNMAQDIYNPMNKVLSREIKAVQWFNYDDAQKKINDYNVERKELFKRADNTIQKLAANNY